VPLSDSASLWVIRRDDHDRSPWTAPNKRLHLHPRGAFYEKYQLVTAAIRVVHNHPSGSAEPSDNDVALTRRIVLLASSVRIQILDHLIVGASRIISMRERELL